MITRFLEIYTRATKTIEFNREIRKIRTRPLKSGDIMSVLLDLGLIDKFEARDYMTVISEMLKIGSIDDNTGLIVIERTMSDAKSKTRTLSDGVAPSSKTSDSEEKTPIIEDDVAEIKLDKDLFIKKYFPLLYDRTFEQTFFGSSGSGKSYFITQRNILWLMSNTEDMPICNILVLRNDEVTNYKSTFPLYKQIIDEWGLSDLFRITERPALIEYIPNGNQIIFAGFNNPENLKSITFKNGILTTVHVEEATEIKQSSAINILKTRLRGKYKGKTISKCIIYSYNPISDLNWVKAFLDDICTLPHPSLVLNPTQSNSMYSVRVDNREHPRKLIMHSTHEDNNFLTEDDHLALRAFEFTDPYYYQVYCLGNYGSAAADYFNKNYLYNRQEELKAKPPTNKIIELFYDYDGLKISKVRPIDHSDEYRKANNIDKDALLQLNYKDDNYMKYITVYEEPKKDHVYCIGSDTSGASGQGTSKYSDFNTSVIVDVTDKHKNPKQVASFRSKCREEELAQTLYCMGIYYNKALISVETNYSTYPVKELQRLKYPNLFVRKQEDNYLEDTKNSFGFQTNRLTRPLLLAKLRQYIQECVENIFDINMIIESLTFGRNDKGRLEALDGAHDDIVMSYGICLYSVEQTPRAIFDTIRKHAMNSKINWTMDLYKDYLRADTETRNAMIDEYGKLDIKELKET